MKNMRMVAKICILTSGQRHTLWYLIIFLLKLLLCSNDFLVCAFNMTVWSELLYFDIWCCTWILGVLNQDKFGLPRSVFILFILKYRIKYVLLPSEPVQWYTLHTQVCLWVCTQTYLEHLDWELLSKVGSLSYSSVPKYTIDAYSHDITGDYQYTLCTWVQDLST